MKILFADFRTPEEHSASELRQPATKGDKRKWLHILIEQLINSAIVGGIAGLTAGAPDVAWKAFALTFLVEMRKYRKL